MRVVVTQEHPGQIEPVRHVLLGLGLECAAGDCVTYTELPVRLAQGPVDLVLVRAGAEAGTTREAVHQAAALTTAPVFALGPATDGQQILQTIQSGAREYLDEARLREQLERALAKLRDSGTVRHGTGLVVGVTSPTLGAGVTTVASNLAFLWGEQQRDQVTLAELGREAAEFALHLDLQPRHTPADLSREWQRMDAALLKRSMLAHPGGVQVLAYPPETLLTAALEPEAVRKAVLLMRTTYAYSVLDLGHLLHDEHYQALRLCNRVVVVVRLDVPALRQTRQLLKQLGERGVPSQQVVLVANRYGERGQLPWKRAEEALGAKFAEYVPDDPGKLNSALNQGQPVVRTSPYASVTRRLRKLADLLAGAARK